MKMTQTLLVGVDPSDTSTAAVRWAADEAIRRDSTLKLVHVWQRSAGYERFVVSRDCRRHPNLARLSLADN